MSNELKNLEYPGDRGDIEYFLTIIIGQRSLKYEDIEAICAHSPYGRRLIPNRLISYAKYFNMIDYAGTYSLDPELKRILAFPNQFNKELINRTVRKLFEVDVFIPDQFTYDEIRDVYVFHNEKLPFEFAHIRNVLVSQGFFVTERLNSKTVFSIAKEFESLLASQCKNKRKKITIEELRKKLEKQSEMGEKAEEFVVSYERKRIKEQSQVDMIRRVSDIDVSAGYDVISFMTKESISYDRYIEVKAYSANQVSFYWSRNEYQIAKLKGEMYFIYLVDIKRINDDDYEPLMICNPSESIMNSEKWLIESESYFIHYLDSI